MTKVEAIKRVLEDNGGVAVWGVIYNQIKNYYPQIKRQKDWKAGIRGVFYRDLGKYFKMIDEGVLALFNYNENNLVLKEDIEDTTISIFTKIRKGQERFREQLLKNLKVCPITGINEARILIASHIKPWAMSSDQERMDINNGFIFSPTVDKLFDRGLITFENNKQIIISPTLSLKNIKKIGIKPDKKYLQLPLEGRISYLEFHRNNIFVK